MKTNSFLLFFLLLYLSVFHAQAADESPASDSPSITKSIAQEGVDYNVTLVTDNGPDLSDIERYLRSITSQFDTPQDKAINIWRWSQRLRKQTSNPVEDGEYVLDPIQLFNSYGHCNCGIVSGLNDTLWVNMEWKARYVQLGDHTVCETSWDGGKTWHLFDASMSVYVFNEKGEVASTTEIEENPRLYLERFAPECGTNPVKNLNDHQGWRCAADRPVLYKRTLANGVDSFLPPNDLQENNLLIRWGHRFVMNFRPGENYTRCFNRLDKPEPSPRYFRPLPNGEDAEKQHGHGNFRATGVWEFSPDLRKPATRKLVYREEGISWETDKNQPAIHPEGGNDPGSIVFKIDAANVVTSAIVEINGYRKSADDAMTLSVSRDYGINWKNVWTANETGSFKSKEIKLGEAVAGRSQYLVKVEMLGNEPANVGIDTLAIKTITQINRPALPKLTRGTNHIQARIGESVDNLFFNPPLQGGKYRETIFAEDNIEVEPEPYFYKATLRPKVKERPAFIVWKMETPAPITDLYYGGNVTTCSPGQRVALYHSWDGQTYIKDFEQTEPVMPRDQMVWLYMNSSDVPKDANAVFFRYEFEGGTGYSGPGIQSAAFSINYQPRQTANAPLEITYCWTEHRKTGDVMRTHIELSTTPKHDYCINVGGYRDPTMHCVRMNLQGYGIQRNYSYGYSDGEDVGTAAEPTRKRYQWGNNLALEKPYRLEGEQSKRNPDSGRDLTDGIVAPPDDYVSEKYMPTNVMFAKDVSPVITLDLEKEKSFSAVRIFAGQPEPEPVDGYRFAYPDRISIDISDNGNDWTPAGFVEHDQVFDPPVDYVPWEHDDDPTFASLPAGGRLHYGYRVIFDKPVKARYVRVTCACRAGWGVLLSEIQVFDSVSVDANYPPLVVLD